jgi:hypothetical protein
MKKILTNAKLEVGSIADEPRAVTIATNRGEKAKLTILITVSHY